MRRGLVPLLAGVALISTCSYAIAQEKDENVIFPNKGQKIAMPKIPEVENRCKRYSNFRNHQGKKLRILVEIDLNCNKLPKLVYVNSSISVGYLICNSMGTAEKIPFGIYIKRADRLYVDEDWDGNTDYIRQGIIKNKRRIYQDAPNCSLSKI